MSARPCCTVPIGVSALPVPNAGVSKLCVHVAVSPLASVPAGLVGIPAESVVPSAALVSVTAVTVMGRCATVNDRSEFGAAAHVASPACDARIVQLPAATIATSDPATVQTAGVSDAKVTPRPLDAVADTATGSSPYVAETPEASNAIVWASRLVPTGKLCCTSRAAK